MKTLVPKYVHTISILRENSMSIFRKQLSNNATIFLLAVIADFVLLSPLFSKFLTSYRHEENNTEKTTRDSNYACPHIIVKCLYNQKLNYIVVVFSSRDISTFVLIIWLC